MSTITITWPPIVESDALAWIRQHGRTLRQISAEDLRRALGRAARVCTWCGQPAGKGRSSWCSAACVESFELVSRPARVAARIEYACETALRRDRDARLCCELCGADVLVALKMSRWLLRRANAQGWRQHAGPYNRLGRKARRRQERAMRALHLWQYRYGRKPTARRWELDHVTPVCEGGGCCGPVGLRVLCVACHRRVTRELANRRANRSKDREAKQERP